MFELLSVSAVENSILKTKFHIRCTHNENKERKSIFKIHVTNMLVQNSFVIIFVCSESTHLSRTVSFLSHECGCLLSNFFSLSNSDEMNYRLGRLTVYWLHSAHHRSDCLLRDSSIEISFNSFLYIFFDFTRLVFRLNHGRPYIHRNIQKVACGSWPTQYQTLKNFLHFKR